MARVQQQRQIRGLLAPNALPSAERMARRHGNHYGLGCDFEPADASCGSRIGSMELLARRVIPWLAAPTRVAGRTA